MEDRRCAKRYPLHLPLHYQAGNGDRGSGHIVDISTRGARIELERGYPLFTEMRLHVLWPVKLHSTTHLRLKINGRVIRVDGRFTVVAFKGYEFVTAGRQAARQAAGEGASGGFSRRATPTGSDVSHRDECGASAAGTIRAGQT